MPEEASKIEVCDECGWHKLRSSHDCWPEAGRAADDLIRSVASRAPGIRATKLGFGGLRVTFAVGDGFSVTLHVSRDGTRFSVEKLFWIDRLDPLRAAEVALVLCALASGKSPVEGENFTILEDS